MTDNEGRLTPEEVHAKWEADREDLRSGISVELAQHLWETEGIKVDPKDVTK